MFATLHLLCKLSILFTVIATPTILQFMVQNHLQPRQKTSWNFFQSHFNGINLKETSFNQSKQLIKN